MALILPPLCFLCTMYVIVYIDKVMGRGGENPFSLPSPNRFHELVS